MSVCVNVINNSSNVMITTHDLRFSHIETRRTMQHFLRIDLNVIGVVLVVAVVVVAVVVILAFKHCRALH